MFDRYHVTNVKPISRLYVCLFLRSLPMESRGSPVPPGGERGIAELFREEKYILEVVLEREPGSGSIHFSAYGCIAPTRRVTIYTCKGYRRVEAIGYRHVEAIYI